MKTIAFDVDGTLIDKDERPRKEIINLLTFSHGIMKVVVCSGGGKEYADLWVRRLGISKYVDEVCHKSAMVQPEIMIDDQEVTLGKVNIQV